MYNIPLQSVDIINSSGKFLPGLVSVKDFEHFNLAIDENVSLLEAKSFENIDYIFFRRFTDGRSSQVTAYIVDNTNHHLNEKELAKLHLRLWLHGSVPLLYVAWPNRIDILTCARGPDFYKDTINKCQYQPVKRIELDTLKTASAIDIELQKLSLLRLADGTFWEEPSNKILADQTKTAHHLLIQAIIEADTDLDGENNPILRRLLLLMVLIKYLEDRQVFPNHGWFGRFHKGAKNFFEVIQGGNPEELYKLLRFLEQKFNGDIFTLEEKDKHKLTKTNLIKFADLVEKRTLNRHRYLWEQFSFKHIPVEIISHLYQRFVGAGHGTVYTPPFLATLLLDYTMPYHKLSGNERILDPACGSGIFLVGALKRLINVWRSQHNWEKPDAKTLKHILENSIYGVELVKNAVDLTAFSLSLAICDALQPDIIWKDLKFDPLKDSNLFEADFFHILLNSIGNKPSIFENKFDIIIGNPPFESKLSDAGLKIEKNSQKKDKNRGSLPDNQVAYLFLEKSFDVLTSTGHLCLIQPHGLLYNPKARSFRVNINQRNTIDKVFDFTSIRKLYAADPKTIAILANNKKPSEKHTIEHLTFRRTTSVQKRLFFEIDHYDRHIVTQKQAENDLYIWRINLLGGGRLLEISKRLRNMRCLVDFIKEKGWDYGEGFIAAKKGRRPPAPFLKGLPLLPTDALTESGIDENRISSVKETHFRSAYTIERYSPPLILIKEIDSLPIAFWEKGYLAYRHQIVGIHAPSLESSEIYKVYNIFLSKHKMYKFAVTLNGTQSLVSKATAILKQDIDLLPYPKDENKFTFSFWEEALCNDILNYISDFIRLGQNSELLKRTAGVEDMKAYSNMFIRLLGSIYTNLKASQPFFFNGLICQPFYFGNKPNISWLEEKSSDQLQKLIYKEEKHKCLRSIRILRLYSENVMFLIKPDRLRYWIKSTAIRDADETIVDLRQQGY